MLVKRACSRTSGADNMPTRNVVLSEHQQQLVETLVQSGRYQNASEVLREGLRLIEERERIEDAKLKAFVGQMGRRAAKLAKTAS
jgi:putative addiction module CopG family antidote